MDYYERSVPIFVTFQEDYATLVNPKYIKWEKPLQGTTGVAKDTEFEFEGWKGNAPEKYDTVEGQTPTAYLEKTVYKKYPHLQTRANIEAMLTAEVLKLVPTKTGDQGRTDFVATHIEAGKGKTTIGFINTG